jgi:hypothetical protein
MRVIHIGFLSSKECRPRTDNLARVKDSPRGRFRLRPPHAEPCHGRKATNARGLGTESPRRPDVRPSRRKGGSVVFFTVVTSHSARVARIVLFRTCEFTAIHSSSLPAEPAAFSRSHPFGSEVVRPSGLLCLSSCGSGRSGRRSAPGRGPLGTAGGQLPIFYVLCPVSPESWTGRTIQLISTSPGSSDMPEPHTPRRGNPKHQARNSKQIPSTKLK